MFPYSHREFRLAGNVAAKHELLRAETLASFRASQDSTAENLGSTAADPALFKVTSTDAKVGSGGNRCRRRIGPASLSIDLSGTSNSVWASATRCSVVLSGGQPNQAEGPLG